MAWIADVVPEEVISSTAWGNLIRDRIVQVFDSEADRNANAHTRPGMLAWSNAEDELSLAVWTARYGAWSTLTEAMKVWEPVVYSGPTTIWSSVNHGCHYRRNFGFCEVTVNLTVTMSATVGTDLIRILPPIAPTVPGVFGMSAMRDSVGTLGPFANCDTTELATSQLGAATLVYRSDLAASGTFDWYMRGSYVTADTA